MTTAEIMAELEAAAPLFPGYNEAGAQRAAALGWAETYLKIIERRLRETIGDLPEETPFAVRCRLALILKDAEAGVEGVAKALGHK